jgi:cytochrome c5
VVVTTGVVVVVEVAAVVVASAVVAVGSAVVGEGGEACFALPLEHAPAASARAAKSARVTIAERARRGPP